jgi:LysM repeat protein
MAMAQEHSAYQASIHRSTHEHSDGRGPPQLGVVENVAGGTSGYITAYDVVYNIWVDPGHLYTLIGYAAGAMGVGVADDGETTYFTLELRPSGAALSSPPVPGATLVIATLPAEVPLVTATPRPDGSIVHEIGYGQSLWAIALAYGVTGDQLRAWNNLPEGSSEIYAGGKLLVRLPGTVMATLSDTPSAPPATATATLQDTPAPSETVPVAASPVPATPVTAEPTPAGWLLPALAGTCLLAAGVLLGWLRRRK